MTPNLSAFLAVIRQCETGTTGPEAYQTLYGGGKFDSFADHPRRKITAGGYTSSAAGAYQILSITWDDFCRARGPRDFSPDNQDLCARWLIDRRHATAAVETGDIQRAIALCNQEWASLPGSPYGQPTRTLEYCLQVYAANGGVHASPPSTNDGQPRILDKAVTRPTKGIQEAHLGATLLASLLPTILGLFSGKAQQAIQRATGADPTVAAEFTQQLFDKLGNAVGISVTDDASAIKAVAAAQALPEEKIKALGDSALGLLVEAGGGGVGGAREFAQQNANNPEMVKILRVVSYWALLFLTWANVAGFILCGFLVYKDKTEWQQIVSTLIQADIAAAMIALGFWLGATLAKSNATTPNLR